MRRYTPTRFDAELLAAVDAAAATGVHLALVVPLPAADTPIILGAATLAAGIVRTARLDGTTTVVSRRLSQRAIYDRLLVSSNRLADVIPRAHLTVDGRVNTIGAARRDSGGRMVLTSDPLRVGGHDGGLVIDATGAPPADLGPLLKGQQPVVYLTDNPFDAALETIRDSGGLVWAFDPETLSRLAGAAPGVRGDGDPVAASAELLAAAGSPDRQVWAPGHDGPMDHALRAAWAALGQLSAVTEGDPSALAAVHSLRWAWGVVTTFSLSVTSPDNYDKRLGGGPYATRLGEAAAHARAVAGNSSGGTRGAWISVAESFADLHTAACTTPKFDLVQSWLGELNEAGRTGLLVTRNRSAAAALTDALEESPGTPYRWHDRITVAGLRDVQRGRLAGLPADAMMLTGPVPRAFASLTAAAPAQQLVVAAAGGWEAGRAARQVTGAVRELQMLRQETITISAPRLELQAEVGTADFPPVLLWRDGTSDPVPLPVDQDTGSPWEPFRADVLAFIAAARRGIDDSGDVPPPSRGDDDETSARVQAMTVIFTDGRALLVAPNDPLYRRSGEDTRQVAAKALRTGDVVALVDASARRDLFDAITDVLADLPDYSTLSYLANFWTERLAAVRSRGLTTRQILTAMQAGPDPTRITTEAAVGQWLRGLAAGPLDPTDVSRFARAVGDEELLGASGAVAAAQRTRRVLHRAVGKWLSAQITGAQVSRKESLVDADLGVHVADLLEAVSVHQVADVSENLALVPAAAVGILLNPEALHAATV